MKFYPLTGRQWLLLLLVLLTIAIVLVDARSRGGSRSFRSYRSYRSYTGSYIYRSYRSPVYTRRLSPSLMGAMYFSYVTRYPRHFSYRRNGISSTGGSCTNYLALGNGSFIGTFSCPFLPDEPNSWTKCCGYDNEQFCCDPAYDDSWKLNRGLSVVAVIFIIVGCLTGVGTIGWLVFYCFKKQAVTARQAGISSAATAATSVGPPACVAPVHVISKSVTMDTQHQPASLNSPPFPTFSGVQSFGVENPGFEPPPYPLYPPPYPTSNAGGVPT